MLILTTLTDNRSNPSERAFALPDYSLIQLQGPDAVAFAQAQFANDLNTLQDGHWHWNTWLTPKGRVIAIFMVARIAADHLLLIVPDAPAEELSTALKRFVFRKKVRVEIPATQHISGLFAAPTHAQGAQFHFDDTHVELDVGSPHQPRCMRITSVRNDEDSNAIAQWRSADLRHGLPRLDATQREQWTPQQLSLARLHAFSVKKGCYPGQEIVARTHFLGKAKRGLALFEANVQLSPGAHIDEGPRNLGQIISTGTQLPYLALAILPLDHAPTDTLHSNSHTLHPLPLLDGLAR